MGSKVKHRVQANGHTFCGRTLANNGEGRPCKSCERVATSEHARSEKACRAESDRQAMQAANAKQTDNDGESVRTVTADIVTPDIAADIDAVSAEHDAAMNAYVTPGRMAVEADRDDAAVLKPVTFADVAESCGWLSTDLDAVTVVADGPVNEGMWNCCMDRPAMAVAFTDDNGGRVWYAACRSCASTVPAARQAVLPGRFVADRMVNMRAELAAGQAAHECVCDVVTRMGAASLPVGGLCCNGCGSIFTREGEEASEQVTACSLRIVRVKAGRVLIEAVEAWRMPGADYRQRAACRQTAEEAAQSFRQAMGWERLAYPNVSHALYHARWAKDMFSELA